ncbi:UDP-N-acetylglucosamine 2-epimerase [Salipaludibacillus sp. CF4.18]|uniref:UDP-N-acetylglucosamine 2-epimerase n=1 Tax=Salipaludibacillus sp. CF4.18 TaxID=3373081 RepID=UPI003EE5D996
MDTFEKNYWSLYLDFIEEFKEIQYNGVPLPLYFRFNRLLNEKSLSKLKGKSISPFLKNKIRDEKQIQSKFDQYLQHGSKENLSISNQNRKVLIYKDSYLRIPLSFYKQYFNSENCIILQKSTSRKTYQGIPIFNLSRYVRKDNRLGKDYIQKATQQFRHLQDHPIFGDRDLQKKFFSVISSTMRDLLAMDRFLTENPVSCVLVADTGTLRIPQLLPRSKGIPSISVQHGLILGWQSRMPVLATKRAVYGKFEVDLLQRKGANKESLAIIGHPRFDSIITQRINSNYAKNNSKKPLILIATQRNNNKDIWVKFIEKVVRKYPVKIMIKPHPREKYIKKYKQLSSKYSQVVVSSPKGSLYKSMEEADIVIVNSSTVGLEAMLFNKIVLVLEMKTKLSVGAKSYFNSKLLGDFVQSNVTKLADVLGSIIDDEKLMADANERMENFLSYAYPTKNKFSGKLLVQLIDQLTEQEKHQKGRDNAMMKTKELLNKQMTSNHFNRVDIVIRYLAIEEYFGKNRVGFKLYRKMQKTRRNYSPKKLALRENGYKRLIKSIEKKGFQSDSPVRVDSNMQLLDGSHRMACALFFNIEEVPVKRLKRTLNVDYSIDWFKDQGFTKNEIRIIEEKLVELNLTIRDS